MKNLTTKIVIAAAALVAVAGAASAQTLEAKIPFAFRASGKVLPPGTYRVQTDRASWGVPLIIIRGENPGQQVIAVSFVNADARKAWTAAGKAVLSFQCGVGRCALSEVWMGEFGTPAYQFRVPRLGKDEPRSVAEIVMRPVKAD